jgi:hypothetical protein
MPDVICPIDSRSYLALMQIADAENSDIPSIIRDAIRRDLFRRTRAKKAVRPDEQLIAPLRALLADDFAYAATWDDLQARLRTKGYALREAGAGLALVVLPENRRVAKASDLGYSYSRLMRRLNAPFPDHAHGYLFSRHN